jgi:hypothetical protein
MGKGLLLAAIQVALVLSLGAKLLYDRTTRPRVWVLCEVYDPELPIRGRYLGERLRMPAEGFTYNNPSPGSLSDWAANTQWAYFEIRDDRLIAKSAGSGNGEWVYLHKNNDGVVVAFTQEPVLVFISDRAELPQLKAGEEMWVEVTVPAKGPPRPLRVGIKKDGVITPMVFK